MSHAEHLGIAFANIVYASLTTIDFEDYDLSISRIFEEDSREKNTLIAFLMKRKAQHFFTDTASSAICDNDKKTNGVTSTTTTKQESESGRCCTSQDEELSPVSLYNIPETSSLFLLERSLAINEVLLQLTVVRNAFVECILRDLQFTSSRSSHSTHQALRPIPIVPSRTLSDSGIRSILAAVSSLSEKLKKTSRSFSSRSLSISDREGSFSLGDYYGYHHAQMLCSAVEIIWAFSLCFILAPRDSALIRLGGFVHCNRFFFCDRNRTSVVSKSSRFPFFLCDLPPVFFLSGEFAMRLNAHFYDVLVSTGSGVTIPSEMRLLLLGRWCYGLLSQVDKRAAGFEWKEILQRCVSAMKMARLSHQWWEDVDWSGFLKGANPSLSTTDCESIACELEFIWRQRHRWWEDTTDSGLHVSESLPFFLSGDLPSFLSSQFSGTTALALVLCSSSKGNSGNKSDKTARDVLNGLFHYTINICHMFSHYTGAYEVLKELLDFMKKIVAYSKKEKRLREIITLALSGCLLSQPMAYVNFHCNSQPQDVAYIQSIIENLLSEINNWRKFKNAMWYSLSMSVLLGGCSVNILAHKLLSFFATMESWLVSADSMDRIAILHATLHAGGLLSDVSTHYSEVPSCEWGPCIESFCYHVEKMLVKVIGCESWREKQHSSSCVEAASDLLLFALQQKSFSFRACHWLQKLLAIKIKTKMLGKDGKGVLISRGQLIAARTISVLLNLQYYGHSGSAGHRRSGGKEFCLVCTSVDENNRNLSMVYNSPLEQKTSIKERIVGFIAVHGSCYRPVVTTVEGLAIFWHGDNLKQVIELVSSSEDVRIGVNILREAAFEYVHHIYTDNRTEEDMESTHQLVPVFLVARFWDLPHVLLDKHLTLPMVLVRPKTPLYETVSRVVLPYYLASKNGGDMWSCALVFYRLVEYMVVLLGKDEDDCVMHLAEYMTLQLTVLRDKMASLVNDELYVQKTRKHSSSMTRGMQVAVDSADEPECQNKTASRSIRWGWLLNTLEVSALQSDYPLSDSLDLRDWGIISGIRNAGLIDTLEGLAVVLLGHPAPRVRQNALKQLELLASLTHLQRLDCETPLQAEDNALFMGSHPSLCGPLTSSNCINRKVACKENISFPRAAVADIFRELGEQFDEMYVLNREHYLSSVQPFERSVFNTSMSMDDKVFSGAQQQYFSRGGSSAMYNGVKELDPVRLSLFESEKPLTFTPFGEHCLSNDGTTPLFVFVSTVALTLLTYGYCPGSALVRVVCAISGEVVERGTKRYMERSAPAWRSCYALNFLLLSVDNVKFSPDADRLTRGLERNRPGHQQGGDSTFVGAPDAKSGIGWQIVNRHAEYNKLMNGVTVPLLLHEINTENNSVYFLDLIQFLFVGPLENVSRGNTSLVTFLGMMDSGHPVLGKLCEIFALSRSKSRKVKPSALHACLATLLCMLLCIGRRYFVRPPSTPGWMQGSIATKRAHMETIIQNVIDSMLLGDYLEKDHVDNHKSERRLSVDALGRLFNEGHGVSARSFLALPFLSPVNINNESKLSVYHNTVSEFASTIFLRGIFCDLITLVYSNDTRFLEQQLKKSLVTKVLCSLTYQVQWFLQADASSFWKDSRVKLKTTNTVREKSIIALKTVVSSLGQLAGNQRESDHTKVISAFTKRFFQWLQHSLPVDCINLESSAPSVFDLAVTLLVADSESRDSVLRVLCELPIGSPVHRAFFAVVVTAFSSACIGHQKPFLARDSSLKRSLFHAPSTTSNDVILSQVGSLSRSDVVFAESTNIGIYIYYSLAYLYEDTTLGPVFDVIVRSKALVLLELMCGEAPVETNTDLLDDWLCLLLKIYRQGCIEVEIDNELVQSLFTMASDDILSAERKTSSPAKLHRIALRLLSFFLRRVQATESNLRTVLQVTRVSRNTCSEHAIATLWGGWMAYEGRERERFVSLLVTSPMDLADKRLVTYYIDTYINKGLTVQRKKQNGKLDARSRGAYYSFLLFSLYQMGLLRSNFAFQERCEKRKSENLVDAFAESLRKGAHRNDSVVCLSRSLSAPESYANKGMNRNGKAMRKFLWIIQENIWRVPLRLTNENLKANFDSQMSKTRHEGSKLGKSTREITEEIPTIREEGFVKPLVSVLYFATWAIERLWPCDWRLWKELHGDLNTITSFMMQESSTEAKSGADVEMFSLSSEVDSETVSEGGNDDDDERLVSEAEPSHSNEQSLSTSDGAALMAAVQGRSMTQENEEEDVGWNSDAGSDNTVVVHASIPATSVTKAIYNNMKQAENFKKETRLKRKKKMNVSFSLLHRDFLALFLHSACMLLVHMGCGEMVCEGERDALSSRFYVVDLAFELLGNMLKGAASEGSHWASSTFKRWLKITLVRLEHHEAMRPRGVKSHDGDASLIFEHSLLFSKTDIDERLSGSASSSTEVVLTELFLSIAGHGSNLRGRHFLLRCLHESFTWLQRGDCGEGEIRIRLHVLYSYISLLSMKIARAMSSCLSFTTGAVVVGCNWRQLWMEKTAMLLAGASAFRRLISAFSRHVRAFRNEAFTSVTGLSMHAHDRVLCTSILTSLGCILRDIIIHETYYCTGAHKKKMENPKQEVLLLSTPFGDKGAFPTRYLLSSFWIGFAFLLDPNMWLAACDVLAVFHRYGCARFLGVISFPLLSPPYQLNMSTAPDCAAVQLVLLRQGKTVMSSHTKSLTEEACGKNITSRHTMDVVLSYLNEYASEKDDVALFLAFSELLLLCDWRMLDFEKYMPKFGAFARISLIEYSQSQINRISPNMRAPAATSSFSRFLCYLAEAWKQSLLLLPIGSESTAQGLSSRMISVLGELFKMAVREFGLSSVNALLHRVKSTQTGSKGYTKATSARSKSQNIDLCSLHSSTGPLKEQHNVNECHASSFQRLFESLVMFPLMSLFQSAQTPLPLWSKILAFVAALLRYHEQNHGFVTDQLLKFLPDIERGLTAGTAYDSFTDETPLNERLVVLVLADEVSAKVKGLRAGPSILPHAVIGLDTRKGLPQLTSFLDDESLVAAIVDSLARDCAFTPLTNNNGQSLSRESVGERAMSLGLSHSAVGDKKGFPPTLALSHEEIAREVEKELPSFVPAEAVAQHSVEDDSSSLVVQNAPNVTTPLKSHRFGEYIYEYLPESRNDVSVSYQLPLEYYHSRAKDSPFTAAANPSVEDTNNFNSQSLKNMKNRAFSEEGFVGLRTPRNAAWSLGNNSARSLSTLDYDDTSDDDEDDGSFLSPSS